MIQIFSTSTWAWIPNSGSQLGYEKMQAMMLGPAFFLAMAAM
jgi:hypothetical protein